MTEKTDAELINDLEDSLKAYFEYAADKTGYAANKIGYTANKIGYTATRHYKISDRLGAIFNHLQKNPEKFRNETFEAIASAMTTLPVYTGDPEEKDVVKALVQKVPAFQKIGNPWRSLSNPYAGDL